MLEVIRCGIVCGPGCLTLPEVCGKHGIDLQPSVAPLSTCVAAEN